MQSLWNTRPIAELIVHFVEQASRACVGLKDNPPGALDRVRMAKRDYYEVLGLDRNASSDDIKTAFRSLARKPHPDKNPDDPDSESKFKEVQEAYAILSNPDEKSVSTIDTVTTGRGEPIWPRWLPRS